MRGKNNAILFGIVGGLCKKKHIYTVTFIAGGLFWSFSN
jgi:hypothetical protein